MYTRFSGSSTFTPKLTIAVDRKTSDPVDAWLSPRTREHLEQLIRSRRIWCQSDGAGTVGLTVDRVQLTSRNESDALSSGDQNAALELNTTSSTRMDAWHVSTVEVPLTSDREFFQILQHELKHLENVQEKEITRLDGAVAALGNHIDSLTASSRSKAEAQAWREILRIYVDAQVFFSSREKDIGIRDSQAASRHLQEFVFAVHNQKPSTRLKGRTQPLFDRFVDINTNLLRLVRFQELNRIAMGKILKKFDKRTALHARDALPSSLSEGPVITQALAKSACFQISQQLLDIVPQLSDYSCPICLNISYKPIRLRCHHVFCIRCLIVMQRNKEGHCPLCREESVLEATSDNLDVRLMSFLEAKFPIEVKIKHRENLRAAGIDKYGDRYGTDFDRRCIVM